VFNATFNNISVISCQPVLLVEHTNVESQNTIMLNYKVEEQTKEKADDTKT
jgi:hypothetical protein